MSVLADLTEEERYLLAILQDQSGIDGAEFCWTDETSPDSIFRCWDFQYCLAGDTQMYTGAGRVPIRDAVGPVRLLTEGVGDEGVWVDAEVRRFGVAPLYAVHLERRGIRRVIRATGNHRWFAGSGRADRREYAELETRALAPGDYLRPTKAPREVFALDQRAIQAGIIRGDGTAYGGHSRVYLYGEKVELLAHFPGAAYSRPERLDVDLPVAYLGSLAEDLKTWTPSAESSLGERWGWLAGYFATDGCVEPDGTCLITSASQGNVDDIRAVALSVGVACSPARRAQVTPTGEVHHVVLRVADLPEDFFLRAHHRTRVRPRLQARARALDAWRVTAVVPDGVEEVFCAVVPETHSFVLDGDILTGNSWYRCNDKFQIDQAGRAVGKSVGMQMRAWAFPFTNAGEEMLLTAPELIHLDPVTRAVERRITSVRLSDEMLRKGGTSSGFTHRPFEATFRNGARIVGRIPNIDGRGVKGMHPLKLEMDEGQDYPEAGWVELGETLKFGGEHSQWRTHGVSRGVRDRYYKQTQEGSGWTVHKLTAMHRDDWNDDQRAAKAELYGSRDHPDFRRNILGLHGDASSSLFVLHRLMGCVDQEQASDYNTELFHSIRINDERVRDSGGPIAFLLDFPSSHQKWQRCWVGMDVGMTNHPSEILIFGEDWAQGRGKNAVPEGRLRLLTRIHLERISAPDQRAVMEEVYKFYRPKGFGMDRTGLGLPLFSEIQSGKTPLARVLKGYNFSEKIVVGKDYKEGVEEGDQIMANVLEFGSDILRELVDSGMLHLPWDVELIREFQGQTYTVTKASTDAYGRRRNFNKGKFHALDAARMAAVAWKQVQLGDLVELEQEFEPIFDSFL